MRTLTEYHNKHVLISGQGATEEIGRTYVSQNKKFELLFFFFLGLDLRA